MAFDINAFLKENKAGVAEEEPQLITSEAEPAKQTAFDINVFLQENAVSPTSARGVKEIERREGGGVVGGAADIGIQFMKGLGTGTRGITDIIGADNPVSKMIAGYEDYMDTLLSAESRNDSKRVAQMLQEAKDGGFLDKISAGFEAFASAPLETTANVAGYMVPQLAIGIVGKVAQLGKAAQVGLTLGTGFAQGVGTAKGNIYQNTKEYLREQGVAEDQIEPIAVKAQSYNGENLDQLLLSGGLNALAASTGAEAILTRALTKQGKEVSGGIIGGILKGAGAEAPIEGVQSAQEEVAKNVALQRLGYDVPTFQGAIESATTGVVAGGFVGGLAGGVEALSPEQKEQRDIDKEAERRARDLEATDPATQAISTELTRLERGIDNKRMDLDALESTSPEASKMRLDIAADQKNLAALKEQANKLGLSVTITEAEKQQIELAKAITTPEVAAPAPKPLPTDVLPTETPGATYGREEQVYDVFAGARRKPVVTEEPPVSMVGKEVIPGVTPVPVVEKPTGGVNYYEQLGGKDALDSNRKKKRAVPQNFKLAYEIGWSNARKKLREESSPTEPTVKESLTVAPIEEELFGKLPTAEAKTTLSENVAEREKPSVKPLKQPSIKQLIARREPIPAKKAYGYKLPSEYKLNYDTEMWEAAPAEAPAITPAPVETAAISEQEPVAPAEAQDIEAGAPPLSTENLYFENNLAQRAWRIAAGFKYDKERGDWFHPSYPNLSRGNAEQEITDTNPPTKAQVRSVLDQLRQKYTPAVEKAAPVETPTFEKGDMVRVPNRVPVYEKGEIAGGKTVMVGGFVTRIMPDGKVEVRLQQGGYATLPPAEIEMRKKASAPVAETPAVTEAPAAEVAPARLYLNVPFNRKESAKSAGAKFDSEKKLWYIDRRPTGELPPIAPSFVQEAETTAFSAKELEPARINAEAQLGQDIEIGSFETPTGTAYGLKVKSGDWINKNINLEIEQAKTKVKPIAAGGGTEMATMESQPSAPGGIPIETADELYSRLAKNKEDEIRKEISEIKKGRKNPKSKWYGARDSEISKREREIGNLKFGNWGIAIDALDAELAAKRPVSDVWNDLLVKLRLSPDEFQARLNRAGYTKQGELYIYQPAVSETITPAAEPAGISVGNRIKLGKSPQTYIVEEAIPQTEAEKANNEQFYSVKNEKTGEVQVVEKADMKQVSKKPKLGQKGGVLIPSREDFIQAGQNIYEAGMEFGAWAKQMIQQFGDVVREFLGDVWQAVSGAPAKLNELMGYLPKKGEGGAVNIGGGKIGGKTEVVTEPAPSGERQQIMGEKIGPLKKTPAGIIAETQSKLRELFDPTKVTEQNTTEAFRALGRLTGKDGTAFAQELNDIGRMVDESGAAAEVSMGAALFVNDLFEYAVRLAAQGNKKMLGIMMTNINRLPTGTEGRSDAGRALRAAREMKDTFLTMAQAEQDAFINYAAEFVYGPNPTKEQVDSIQIGYDAVEKVQEPTAKEVEEEIAAVGEKTGTDLVGRINDEFTKATEKGQAKRKTEIDELDSEYKKIQEQADKEIEKLAKIQSDTPSFDPTAARQTANDVRAIVANDLKQRPDMGRKAPWKSMLVAKLQEAGVEVAAAETLADIVWRQHEINNLSRELSSINKAIEKGPISEIVKAIKETPLEEQQNPNWRYEVMRDYLRRAGLSLAQAERIAKLMDISLQKRFTQAKEQAFTDAISKTAPWKAGDVRSKRAFQQVIQAIRSGALDPSRNMASDIAALNGWTGFSPDQYKNLLKNDAILADPKSGELQKAEAYKAIQDIISKSKLPIRARDVIGQYYDAQALSGIPTLTVNSFSPIAFAMRNAIVEAGSGAIKGDAKAIGRAATAFVDSIKSWANTVAFSFKNNVTVYSNVDYIVNDDNLLRLYRKGVDQFTKSKNAKERADGVKNMMIGMMDYVRRILNALDYGAIASLQNQNISKYAMAVMKRQGMSTKEGNEMFAVMMKAKNDFYLQQIANGMDKNKASILADEYYISSWSEALTKAGVEKSDIKQAMDAAINDALSSVGRNRQSLDAFKEEDTKLKDAGVSSMPALWLLESVANAANRSDNQIIKLFSRVIYGFAIVPARVIRETAWFSPYGFVRFGYDAIAKKMGKTSPYAQSLGTDIQYSQRLNEAVAGTVALVALLALRAGSTDDPEDEDEFKIVFTGNGPQRKDDAQFYDSWYKAGNKPNSMILSFGKTKFTLNMMRGFEAFTWPAMMLGALDDLEIRKKQKQQTKTPAQLEDAAIVAGFVFDAALRRGPYAFTTKSLFGTYGDIGVEGVAKGLTFPAKTLIPVLGTSLASNLSNFLNDPIDRRTLDGAVWSNIPFIGPAVAPKSLNAFGEPSLSTDFASKMFKLGVPIVYDIPTDRESIKLHELVLKQGGGPSIPTRNQLAQRLDRQPTNKEYEMFVREYGTILTTSMKKNYDKLFNAKPEFYSKAVERIGNRARDVAENKVRQAAKKP